MNSRDNDDKPKNVHVEASISFEIEQLAKNEFEVNEELWNKQVWTATT